jgi:hypothetical protein
MSFFTEPIIVSYNYLFGNNAVFSDDLKTAFLHYSAFYYSVNDGIKSSMMKRKYELLNNGKYMFIKCIAL